MGKRGPKKEPDALQRLKGHPAKARKRRTLAVMPSTGAPRPPRWLDPIARAEWRRLSVELHRLGLLTMLDLGQFGAYCQAYARWRRAERRLAARLRHRDGELVTTKSGYGQIHPLITLAKQAIDTMTRLAAEFGLSPSARASLALPLDQTAPIHDRPDQPAPAADRDEFETFLKETRQRGPSSA